MNKVKLRHKLFFKIFATFWLFVFALISTVLVLPLLSEPSAQPAPAWALKTLKKVVQRAKHPPRGPHHLSPRTPEQWVHKHRGEFDIHLVSHDGQLISKLKNWKSLRSFVILSEDPQQPKVIYRDKKVLFGPVQVQFGHQHYQLYLSSKGKQFSQRFSLLIEQKGLLFILVLLISTLLCALLAWYITSPLNKLEQAAQQIANGELEAQIPKLKRRDEIASLSLSLNKMVTSLNSQLQHQKRLLSDISHELRSPLTRLMMATGIAQKKWGKIAELERIEQEAQKIEAMIASLLQLTRLQHQEGQKQHLALQETLQNLVADMRFEAQQSGKLFTTDIDPQCQINGYRDLLLSAIENICRNALRYAKQRVVLKVEKHEQVITISVYDDGPGVANNELDSIFRPFYRPSQSRDRQSGGVGLGLAIAANAAKQHQGSIEAHNLSQTEAKKLQLKTQMANLHFQVQLTLPSSVQSLT